ncbi:myosin class II heavy chain (MHC) [Purpureocillium lavendulum]|uniref:Myosin class II heavy chain (MHC) n=1 Tax=Purpureocillium lavendulum TaxID=1247861 RepID=A0AB34FZ55_9HYPO|nr:myosin class II heavy chain (MHC) [Purpureocillium lavendulum]
MLRRPALETGSDDSGGLCGCGVTNHSVTPPRAAARGCIPAESERTGRVMAHHDQQQHQHHPPPLQQHQHQHLAHSGGGGRNPNRASYPPPLFAAELDTAPMHGTVPAPSGGFAFEMCGDSAAPRRQNDEPGSEPEPARRPVQASDEDAASMQANPWPFYLEETASTTAGKKDDKKPDETADEAPARESANPWPYHGPSGEGDDGPRATVYPQVLVPDSRDTGPADEGGDGIKGEERVAKDDDDAAYPAPLKITRSRAASPKSPTYQPYSPPPEREGAAEQDSSVRPPGPAKDGTTTLAYRPYQPPESPPPPSRDDQDGRHASTTTTAAAMGVAPHHYYTPPEERPGQTASSPRPHSMAPAENAAAVASTAAAVTPGSEAHGRAAVGNATEPQPLTSSPPAPPKVPMTGLPLTSAATSPGTPHDHQDAMMGSAQRPVPASPQPPTMNFPPPTSASMPHSPSLSPPGSASGPGPQQPIYAPQPYPQGAQFTATSPVPGMTPISPLQGYPPPMHSPSPVNSTYSVPQQTYTPTTASPVPSPYQTYVPAAATPQPQRPPVHQAMSDPNMPPQYNPQSPPPPYPYGSPGPGSQPAQYQQPYPPPSPANGGLPPSPYAPHPPYNPADIKHPPPLPPRPMPGPAVAYPPPPKTMYPPRPQYLNPPPLPPRNGSGGSGSLFSSASKWLDKTSQVLETKLEAVLQGPQGPPNRPAYAGVPPPQQYQQYHQQQQHQQQHPHNAARGPGPPGPQYGYAPGPWGPGPGQGGPTRYA